MIVEIAHAGFRMRDDTEHVRCSLGAMAFFDNFEIPYVLDEVGDNVVIRYHESLRRVSVELDSVLELRALAVMYSATIELRPDGEVMINFS